VTRAIALIDGEHYATTVRDALADLPYEFVGAVLVGGTEKLREGADYGVAVSDDLEVALRELEPEVVVDLSDEPVLGPVARFRVASRVLAERLFEEVRTKRNLTYAVSAGLGTREANRGNLYVTAVQPDTTLKVMQTEVRKLQQEPVPVSRLGQTINVFLTGYLMSQQSNMGQAADLGLWEISGGGWANSATYLDRVRKVTPADVQRSACTYMKSFSFVMLGDTSKVNRGFVTSF
jgi:hypothetical protein